MAAPSFKKITESITYAPHIDVDISRGLSEEDVLKRKKLRLENKTKKHVSKSYWKIFTDNFFNALNIILFAVFALMVYARLSISHYVFMVILGANIVIGVMQDIHSRRLTDKLKVLTDPRAKVLRSGKETSVAVNEIVLSDILLLSAGNQIPADSVVVDGECSVDESMLSGESVAVEKKKGDMLLSGSYLVKGNVKAEVKRVGNANYAEQLQSTARQFSQPKSEIKSSTAIIIRTCAILCVILGAAQIALFLFREMNVNGNTFFEAANNNNPAFVSAVEAISGSMVAMIPAGMVLLTSAALASGVVNLANKKMLVQQLYCIEMLARVDMICFDKTGTLTDGTLKVHKVIPIGDATFPEIEMAIRDIVTFTKDSNATANALKLEFGTETSGICKDFIAFDSAIKASAVTLSTGVTYAMGAFGYLKSKKNERLERTIDSYASKGYRCLVVVKSKKPIVDKKLPDRFEYLGLVVLSDHIKEDAKDNVAWFQNNGVEIKVISGDDPVTVSEIARRCGVKNADLFVSLEGKSVKEVEALADKYAVFGRASPEQKAVLVSAFQTRGRKVAMTGDGVNDVLALKIADCSIAMASGSEAARNVAHLVSLESNFSRLPDVVAQGRRVINNLQRSSSLFLNKTFFAVITTIVFFLSSLMGGRMYPFSTSNLLVWEVLAIGIAAFFLALQPSNERLSGSFGANIASKAFPSALSNVISALVPFIVFLFGPGLLSDIGDINTAFSMATTISVLTFTINSFVILFATCLPKNRYRLIVFGGVFVLGAAVLFTDFGAKNELGVGPLLAINWIGLTPHCLWILPVSIAIFVVLFILSNEFVKYLRGFKGGENKEVAAK